MVELKETSAAGTELRARMGRGLNKLSRRYAEALQGYVACGREDYLQTAYELGRRAIAQGLGVLDMVRLHHACLLGLLDPLTFVQSCLPAWQAAETFFMEALSPFEATHRGFRETSLQLGELNQTLARRNLELAAINRTLKQEIRERKRTEEALRESGEHYQVLFNEAREMQENLRHLSNQMLHLQEEERKRISRELHDEVGQALTAINMHLAVLRQAPVLDTAVGRKKIAEVQQLLEQTMDAVHHFARELRPAMLDDLGLGPALRSYANSFAARTGIRVQCQISASVERLGGNEKLALYRVAQESLTNVAKHAHAGEVRLAIDETAGGIRMEIADNGRAFQVDRQLAVNGKKRLGLLGMGERVRLINGEFSIASQPGKGTTVRVVIPCAGASPDRAEARAAAAPGRPSRPAISAQNRLAKLPPPSIVN